MKKQKQNIKVRDLEPLKNVVDGRRFIGGVLCLAAITLICARASAQNLFVSDFDFQGNYGIIDEFTPNGVRSTFASGLNDPSGLAFDKAGNLFVADAGSGAIYKFTPAGVRTTFASGLPLPDRVGLAFDSAGNLCAVGCKRSSV
jgi:DNA-binding beta-propeller fold protein YncE